MIMEKFTYTSGMVPKAYVCSKCGRKGKMWRQYNTLACFIELLCAECAQKDQETNYQIGQDGFHDSGLWGSSCEIQWLVPAVPTEDGYTYWGYTSTPWEGWRWWKRQPLGVPVWYARAATVAMLAALVLALWANL